ncbi:MAG: histidine--tRNA ligase [Myxococcaceae bacterium]
MKGMNDLFSKELQSRRLVASKAIHVFENYGFSEIQTPILEELSLFVRSVGENTDIVSKEMYSLEDRDGTKICMRPENTAGAVRALIENNLVSEDQEAKVFYIGPMFRRERPQKGRLREFTQIGAEFLGISAATADIEFLAMLHDWLSSLPIGQIKLVINSLGQPNERNEYLKALRAYFEPLTEKLCVDCQKRLTNNVLRLLDCKNETCSKLADAAPSIHSYLAEESKQHFEAIQAGLKQLNIPFQISNRLVRGLDYYTRTVFEFIAESGLGAQNTLAGGGRYDNLVKELGGPDVPAIGMAAGLERIILLMRENGLVLDEKRPDLSLVAADSMGRQKAFELLILLRRKGLFVDFDHKERSVKSQMRRADRLRSKEALVLGTQEVESGKAKIKSLDSGETREVELSDL